MAQSKNNIITHGLSGKVGDLIVFRSWNGKTIVASKPTARTSDLTRTQKQPIKQPLQRMKVLTT